MAEFAGPTADETSRLACQFTRWFPCLSHVTMKSRVVELPDDFVEYLREDGVVLPKAASAALGSGDLSDDDDDAATLREVGDDAVVSARDFPAVDAQIRDALEELGGEVFPKLNWSCPLDAAWMNGGTLKCVRLADVYLLLKSSDRVMFDVEHMLEGTGRDRNRPDQVTLILRKWANLQPAMEFRAFVRDERLVGVCQRDCCTFYDFLQDPEQQNDVADLIDGFFKAQLLPKAPLSSYIADLYIDKKGRVWVVDLNVFGLPTDPLLFDWGELLPSPSSSSSSSSTSSSSSSSSSSTAAARTDDGGGGDAFQQDWELRVVESRAAVRSSEKAAASGPIDVTLAPDFHRFMEIARAQASEEQSDGEGEGE